MFTGVALHTDIEVTVRLRDDAELVAAEATVGRYFRILGAKPMLGRVFAPEENSRVDGTKVVVARGFYPDSTRRERFVFETCPEPVLFDSKVFTSVRPHLVSRCC